jgi:molecular chaperone DnaK
MKYVGIDLGTTNSAICSYDGENVRLYKSPEQNDVTPSAIFIDRRGNKFLGKKAYDLAARNPGNAATKFKRMMGTSTPIELPAVGKTFTPEECSAEILKVCFSYLPEELRDASDTGTVVTVPAAFNQMQKEATLAAAEMAGLGRVALMQEPVAAVMSVMRHRKGDGIFLVFDLGGGTLDIAIAESISGRVSLLAHGGIAMCGGTDFDRAILDNLIKPWLLSQFDLPDNLSTSERYRPLMRMCLAAAEHAKITLSSSEQAVISVVETDLNMRDEAGDEIYVDLTITRAQLDALIADRLNDAIGAARETLTKVGLTAHDVERVVFVGGPTQYKPLRDKVSFELGITPSTDVNPMTAVAEGAAVFAESIDWSTQNRSRKSARGSVQNDALNLTFNYVARTPDVRARIVAKLPAGAGSGAAEFQIDSVDTGWTSGRVTLRDGAAVEVTLAKPGENAFKAFVFDRSGRPLTLPNDRITITRTAASIDAIPASHSIGVEARPRPGAPAVLAYMVKAGDQLPKKGQMTFRAEETLKASSSESLKFRLWEGEFGERVEDNHLIGMMEIRGTDIESGAIAAGADLICDFEMLDSGAIRLQVSVPSIGGLFDSQRQFYSAQETQIDFTKAAQLVAEQTEQAANRISEIEELVDDPRLDQARERIASVQKTDLAQADPESLKRAMGEVQEARRVLAGIRRENLAQIRQQELEHVTGFFDRSLREHATPAEASSFDNLARTAARALTNLGNHEFEALLSELYGKAATVLWRQEWFIIDTFQRYAEQPGLSSDAKQHADLVAAGRAALQANDTEKLRSIVYALRRIRITTAGDEDMLASANIILG